MILKTLSKERKESLRNGKAKIAFAIVIILLFTSVWVSSKQYENANKEYLTATENERHIWDNQGEKNPHSAAHYGTYAFKPKQPLSLIDKGVDKYVGTSIFLEAHNRNEAQFSAAADQTGTSRFGELTPDFILLFLMPLLIILLGYNIYTKEKEQGTFFLLKSIGASVNQLTFGKWLSLFMPIFLCTSLLFIIAGILLSNLSDYGEFSWAALLVMWSVYMVFYIVFINIVMFISYISKRSGISLVMSLTVWIITCLIAPKIASTLAEGKYPYPTRQEFQAMVAKDKKQGLDGHNPWNKEAQLLQEKVLKEYKVDSLHQLPFNFDAYRMQKGEEHQAAIYFKHYNNLKDQYQNQSKTYKSLAAISPFLPTRFLSMSIAQTDYATHWDFSDAAENYRIETQKFLNDNFAQNSSLGEWGYKADASTWSELPQFNYTPQSLLSILNTNSSYLIILGLWALVSFSALFLITKLK
jgi:ABC-2 type transport system permease protein